MANSLQYVDKAVSPVIKVAIDSRRKRITIRDNGRSMNWQGLQNFFVMHGENQDRKEGNAGRGRFGTGKSAAFGIASLLRLTTVQGGRRSTVEISRGEIEAMISGEQIPVRVVEQEVPTLEPNGTLVEIEQVHLRSIDQAGVIQYIERHLARYPRSVSVFVNNHECEVSEPPVSTERLFRPAVASRSLLGDVELTIKVSKRALAEDRAGSRSTRRASGTKRPWQGARGADGAISLGAVDVPRLEEDASPVSPFDVSRSVQLNRSNDLVRSCSRSSMKASRPSGGSLWTPSADAKRVRRPGSSRHKPMRSPR